MTKKIVIFLFFFLLVIAQISILPNFFAVRSIPDLVLIVLIFFSARRGFSEIWGVAIAAGILLDIFSFFPAGVNTLSFVLTALVTSFLAQRFLIAYSTWKFLTLILLIIIGTVINDLAVVILMQIYLNLTNAASTDFLILISDLWLKILNNSFMFILIYWPLKKIENLKNMYGQKLILRNNIK